MEVSHWTRGFLTSGRTLGITKIGPRLKLLLAVLMVMTLTVPMFSSFAIPSAQAAQGPGKEGTPPADAPPPPPVGVATFTALEIFAAEAAGIPTSLHPSPVIDSTPVPAGLPPGSTALFVIEGVVADIKIVGSAQEWQIGSQPFFVYNSADTRIDGAPVKGDLVKVIANRTLAPGPLVAERITVRQLGPLAVGPADAELAFLFSGTVTGDRNDIWVIGGFSFVVNDPALPAEIELGLGVGSAVTVEFVTVAAL